MSARDSGAAWLTSCALVFHCPNQQLSFTEVSVTADLLSHFDLTLASEGAWPKATAESHLPVAWNAPASFSKNKKKQGSHVFPSDNESRRLPGSVR